MQYRLGRYQGFSGIRHLNALTARAILRAIVYEILEVCDGWKYGISPVFKGYKMQRISSGEIEIRLSREQSCFIHYNKAHFYTFSYRFLGVDTTFLLATGSLYGPAPIHLDRLEIGLSRGS